MIGRETIRVVQPGKKRIKIFADFWNVIINARSHTGLDISVSWDRLAEHIVSETHIGFDDTAGSLAGMYIFGSYNKSNNKEYRFVNETLDRYGSLSGLFFDFKERKLEKKPPINALAAGNLFIDLRSLGWTYC